MIGEVVNSRGLNSLTNREIFTGPRLVRLSRSFALPAVLPDFLLPVPALLLRAYVRLYVWICVFVLRAVFPVLPEYCPAALPRDFVEPSPPLAARHCPDLSEVGEEE